VGVFLARRARNLMNFDIQVGQVWRHHHEDDDHPSYSWDDLWLLVLAIHDAFLALHLESGELATVFPTDPPKTDWEHVL